MAVETLTVSNFNSRKLLLLLLTSLTLISCVTINIYFPAAAAEKAAEQIVDDVLNTGAPAGSPNDAGQVQPAPGDSSSVFPGQNRQPANMLGRWMLAVVDSLIPRAQTAANISIETPKIRSIRNSMEQRQAKLQPFYQSGSAGFTNDGMIAIVSSAGLSVQQKSTLSKLISAENADRSNLYKEIAVANGHPEWQADVQKTFARTWINRIPGGWKYQNAQGQWVTK